MKQSEVAKQMRVSKRTLSLWEADLVYPTWRQQPKVKEFLGYDPCTDPSLGQPGGNKTQGVAILSLDRPASFGEALRNHRLSIRKTIGEFAKELGVDAKTVRNWEIGLNKPCKKQRHKLSEIFRCGSQFHERYVHVMENISAGS